MKYTLEHLNELYDLELDKVVARIKKQKAKFVLLQFPDGLKQYATSVVDYLEKQLAPPVHQSTECGCKFLIWLGTCYGACDTPVLGKELEKKIDLTIQFGHNELMPSY
jgi:2-(3-amino-3-carboxypropyl)histidine synthase